jgi:hypothetical protein
VRKSKHKPYLDYEDGSSSTSRLLIWQALKEYSTKALLPLLNDKEAIVRTAVAREFQVRGGSAVWRLAKGLSNSRRKHDRVMGLFILSQLGTPSLPYQQQSFDLIDSLLRRERSSEVIEEALYAIGHLRKGQPIRHEQLVKRIVNISARRGSALSNAKAFALRK